MILLMFCLGRLYVSVNLQCASTGYHILPLSRFAGSFSAVPSKVTRSATALGQERYDSLRHPPV